MVIAAIIVLSGAGAPDGALLRFQYSQLHMGVRVNVTGYAPDVATGERAASAAFARFAELEAIMSDYRPDSELMRLTREPQKVSADLRRVLERSREVAWRSGGAFDPTVGPMVQLWRASRRNRTFPDRAAFRTARQAVSWRRLEVTSSTVRLRATGMRLDLGGIAKGDACDQALDVLAAHGVDRAMVDAGGDLAVSGPPPGQPGWRVTVAKLPGRVFSLRDQAMSTSGDSEQFVILGGRRYSHIVDPRTGWALTNGHQVTVIARRGLTTDPLATALCVLGPGTEAEALLRTYRARAIWAPRR